MVSERAPAAGSNGTAVKMAGVEARLREAETVTGVCVTGAGSVGAIAHGQGAAACGVREDDCLSR